MAGTIVIGFDGSDCGEDALALGLVLCRATGASPVVAVVYPEQYPIGVGRVDAEWVAYLEERAEELLQRARRVLGDGVAADYRTVSAASESRGLHELAEREQAEVVVVGSTHRGPLGRTYPGSTGDRLLQGSAWPVAVAPRGLREDPPPALRTIAVAFLDTPEAHEALDFAAALAQRSGARLRLLSVLPSRAEVFAPVVGRDAEAAFASRAREVFQAALDHALAGLGGGWRRPGSCWRATSWTRWRPSTAATPTCWSAARAATARSAACCSAASPRGCCAGPPAPCWWCRAATSRRRRRPPPRRPGRPGTAAARPVYRVQVRTPKGGPLCADARSCSPPSSPPRWSRPSCPPAPRSPAASAAASG